MTVCSSERGVRVLRATGIAVTAEIMQLHAGDSRKKTRSRSACALLGEDCRFRGRVSVLEYRRLFIQNSQPPAVPAWTSFGSHGVTVALVWVGSRQGRDSRPTASLGADLGCC